MTKNYILLEKLCTKIGDGLHGTPTYEDDSGCYFINGNNLKNGSIVISKSTKEVSKKDYMIHFRELHENTLLLSINGTLGEMAFYKGEKIMLGKSVAFLNFKTDINKYFFYYFKQKNVQKHLWNIASGSTIKNLGLYEINNLIVPNPEKEHWKPIVKTLSILDEKIHLNNQINKKLESKLKLIFDYWFMQFNFPDKNNNPYRISGGEMEFNEDLKRDIPNGWKFIKLSALESNIVTGKTPPTDNLKNFNGRIPFICIGDLRDNMHVTKSEITLSDIGANTQVNKFIPKGAICVSCIASPGLVAFASKKSQTNQQLNSIICKKDANRYFLYFFLKAYFKFAKAKTGNTFANMNKDDFASIKILLPKDELIERFRLIAKSSFDRILINTQENDKLLEMRDWLIPNLINGKIKVN